MWVVTLDSSILSPFLVKNEMYIRVYQRQKIERIYFLHVQMHMNTMRETGGHFEELAQTVEENWTVWNL